MLSKNKSGHFCNGDQSDTKRKRFHSEEKNEIENETTKTTASAVAAR